MRALHYSSPNSVRTRSATAAPCPASLSNSSQRRRRRVVGNEEANRADWQLLLDETGILKELDTAIRAYQDFEARTQGGFDIKDLEGLYHQFSTEYKRLPDLHVRLWSFFSSVTNKLDREQYRQVLAPKFVSGTDGEEYDGRQKLRDDFYEAVTAFGLCLQTALSSRSFFEDKSFSEALIARYKADLRFFTEVCEPDGVYLVHQLGQSEDPKDWSEEKTRNETDMIRTRLRKTIEQGLAEDPYAQKVFGELLRQAIADAEAMFDHPLKQYTLFQAFEQQLEARETPGVPDALIGKPNAKAYFGAIRMVMGDEAFAALSSGAVEGLVQQALAMDIVVRDAVAENSLNPQNIDAGIRKGLLPLLFGSLGLDNAKQVVEQVIQITRVHLSKS